MVEGFMVRKLAGQSISITVATLPVRLTGQELQMEACRNTINNQTHVTMLGCLHSCVNSGAAPIKGDPAIHHPCISISAPLSSV